MRRLLALALAACSSSSSDPSTTKSDEPRVVAEAGVASGTAGDGTHALGDACTPHTSCGVIHTSSCGTGDDTCKVSAFCGDDGRCAFVCSFVSSGPPNGTLQSLCTALGGSCKGDAPGVCHAP